MKTGISRNLAANVAGLVAPVASAFITVPFYLHYIGASRYGVVSITWILLGYLGFLDFGLSRSAANALGRLAHAPAEERAPVLVTTLYLSGSFGLVAAAVLYFVGGSLLWRHFSLPPELQQEAIASFPWMVPMLPLSMLIAVALGALESRERFMLSNMLNGCGVVLGQVVPLVCAIWLGPSLRIVIPAVMLVRAAVAVAMFAVVFRLEWPIRSFAFNFGWARKLFGYGAWVSVSSLISPILDTFDQMVIGRLLGPAAVAHYAVPMNIATRSQVLAAALARTLFPRLSREPVETGRRLTAHATLSLIYVFGAMCGPAIIIMGPFLDLWVGRDFAQSSRLVAEILLFGAWMNGIAFLPYNQLQAQGRPDVTAHVHTIEVVPFVVTLWFLTLHAGLAGAAIAWVLRVGGDCIALIWLAGCLRDIALRALPAVALMVASFALAEHRSPDPLASLGVAVIVSSCFLAMGTLLDETLRGVARFVGGLVLRRNSAI